MTDNSINNSFTKNNEINFNYQSEFDLGKQLKNHKQPYHLYLNNNDIKLNVNPCSGDPTKRTVYSGGYLLDSGFVPKLDLVYNSEGISFLKAGPRKNIIHNINNTRAGILTCGGICPGLNVVIREIYMTLYYNYGVQEIYGIKHGYIGIYSKFEENYIKLNSDTVKSIHKLGGTILGTSRGGFDLDKIINSLIENKINILFIIGGDGTHRGIQKIADECIKRKLNISIIGIPKTIDNDIPVIDRTFGFETAVEEACKVIQSATIEATCAINGVGIVKLFGRSCGFIALYASLASRDVNVCIIPEEKLELYGNNGFLEFVYKRVKERGHCVVVVAEGASDAITDLDIKSTGITDKSGNIKLPDVGTIIREEITKHFKLKNEELTLKYIDPTYIIRAGPTNAFDTHYCARLANNAVHGAMAGYTNFTSGVINNEAVYIPIEYINGLGSRKINPYKDHDYLYLLGSTGQPAFRSIY